ncbi:adhesin [Aggregatibacter kilianii]|uniref:adhesin n=1 Tax=Aggregatibacter kilianii TaxID=2025884 RepID=UPI000D65BB54|nr:adhesin [Aggregatibacter kilianii]
MKNLLKPFRYSIIATAIALVFNQPAFASDTLSQTNNQQSSTVKTKGKTQAQKKSNIANTPKESVDPQQAEIQRITSEQRIARQKAEAAQKEAEARAIAQIKEKRQQSQAQEKELAQKNAELIQREYLEAKRKIREQEAARQKTEEYHQATQALAAVKLKNTNQQHLTDAQQKAQEEAERLASEQEIARQKIKANKLQQAIDEQNKLAEVARVKRALIEQKQDTPNQQTDEKLRQQAIEEERRKEELANAERERLEAERRAREEEIANKKAEEARKKSEELARRERERLAREQEIARQKAEEEDRQRALEEQKLREEAAQIEREYKEAERLAREQEIARQKASEEERQRAIEAQRQQEENARLERERAEREEAQRLAREQELARQQKAAEEERQRAIEAQRQQEENARLERNRVEQEEAQRLAREQEIVSQKIEEKPEENPVILARSASSMNLANDMEPLDIEAIHEENAEVENTADSTPKEHLEITHNQSLAETIETTEVIVNADEVSGASENPQPVETVAQNSDQTTTEVVAQAEGNPQSGDEATIAVAKLLTAEVPSAMPETLEPVLTEAAVISETEVTSQPEVVALAESAEAEVAPQAPTAAYNPNEMFVSNAIVSDAAILNALNLDLSGRLDRKLDRSNFYRPLGGVWVEYVNSDMHGRGGDTKNYRAKSSQITLGNDEAQLDNGVVLGGTFTHAKTNNEYGPLSGKNTFTKITAYAKQNFDEYSKSIDIGYGWSSSKIGDSKLKRKIISVGMNFAYDIEFEDLKVTPIWGLRYHHLSSTGGEVNGLSVRSPGFSMVAYHAGLKFSNTYTVDGIEVTPAFSTYYVTTLGKSYNQNVNGKEFGVNIGPYWHNDASLSIGLQDWNVSAYAGVNQGKHGERQNQLGVKLNYYW